MIKIEKGLIGYTGLIGKNILNKTDFQKKFNSKIAYGAKNEVTGADLFLDDGDALKVGNLELKIIHTPGHTGGCICSCNRGSLIQIDIQVP